MSCHWTFPLVENSKDLGEKCFSVTYSQSVVATNECHNTIDYLIYIEKGQSVENSENLLSFKAVALLSPDTAADYIILL